MTLREWIAKEGITQRKAAKRLKTDAPTLSRWLSETFAPNMKRAYQIEKITKGHVPMWTWVAKKPPFVAEPTNGVTPDMSKVPNVTELEAMLQPQES